MPASTSVAFLTPLEEFFVGGLPPLGLMQLVSQLDIKHPTSTAILASTWVGGDPGDFPAASNPSSCFLLFSISLSEGGVPVEGAPNEGPFLQPALGVTFILAI